MPRAHGEARAGSGLLGVHDDGGGAVPAVHRHAAGGRDDRPRRRVALPRRLHVHLAGRVQPWPVRLVAARGRVRDCARPLREPSCVRYHTDRIGLLWRTADRRRRPGGNKQVRFRFRAYRVSVQPDFDGVRLRLSSSGFDMVGRLGPSGLNGLRCRNTLQCSGWSQRRESSKRQLFVLVLSVHWHNYGRFWDRDPGGRMPPCRGRVCHARK
mmetsp:Transcript_70876/g.184811  ORF Transcript_70876/g.184811 Transcript_70876/m.184811 type:complete len:211 (-) Transcript_70876:703-1335(-)